MRNSIFQLESQKTYKDEYSKMLKVLMSKCVSFKKKEYTYFDYINEHLFNNWKFRGTYIDCYEYLESIGVNLRSKKINRENFLNFIEFLCNMQLLTSSLKYYSEDTKYSVQCKSILVHNIKVLLDSYGYEAYSLEDRILILEKNLDYDSLMNILPDDIYECLLSYKDMNNSGIKMKRLILYKIYDYMSKDIEKYKNYNTSLFNSIKLIITKLGVIGEIDKKYVGITNYKLRKYYDSCYHMMTYLIQTEKVLKEKEQLKNEL